MRHRILGTLVLAIGLLAVRALHAQAALQGDYDAQPDRSAQPLSPARALAGVANYPDAIRDALLTLAGDAKLFEQIARTPSLLDAPEQIAPQPPAEMRTALDALRDAPEAVVIAASDAAATQALRAQWLADRAAFAARVDRLREGYARSERQARFAWQDALERDPVALAGYRDLLSQFVRQRAGDQPDYPRVAVLARPYYYACLPDGDVLELARSQPEFAAVLPVLERWYESFGPQRSDQRALAGAAGREAQPADRTTLLAERPAEERRSMWSESVSADDVPLGFVPVILQPPGDQPAEARLARAIHEHARIWGLAPDVPAAPPAPPAVAELPHDEPIGDEPAYRRVLTQAERDSVRRVLEEPYVYDEVYDSGLDDYVYVGPGFYYTGVISGDPYNCLSGRYYGGAVCGRVAYSWCQPRWYGWPTTCAPLVSWNFRSHHDRHDRDWRDDHDGRDWRDRRDGRDWRDRRGGFGAGRLRNPTLSIGVSVGPGGATRSHAGSGWDGFESRDGIRAEDRFSAGDRGLTPRRLNTPGSLQITPSGERRVIAKPPSVAGVAPNARLGAPNARPGTPRLSPGSSRFGPSVLWPRSSRSGAPRYTPPSSRSDTPRYTPPSSRSGRSAVQPRSTAPSRGGIRAPGSSSTPRARSTPPARTGGNRLAPPSRAPTAPRSSAPRSGGNRVIPKQSTPRKP